MLEPMLAWAELGWRVFPLARIGLVQRTAGGDHAKANGKHPHLLAAPNGYRDATTDPSAIRGWFARYGAEIGGIGGSCLDSGRVVLDVDGPEAASRWAALEADHGQATTRVHATGRADGAHRIYLAPAEPCEWRAAIGAGLEIKANGYIVLPPSPHESGRHYAETGDSVEAPMPEWLLGLARKPIAKPRQPSTSQRPWAPPSGRDAKYAQGALAAAMETVRSAPEGHRETTLRDQAFSVGGFAEHLPGDAWRLLAEAAVSAGLSESEAADKAQRAWEAGAAKPKEIPASTRPMSKLAQPGNVHRLPVTQGSDVLAEARRSDAGMAPVVSITSITDLSWETTLLKNKELRIMKEPSNVQKILKHDRSMLGVFGYDEFRQRPTVVRAPPWHDSLPQYPRDIRDADANACLEYLADRYKVCFSRPVMSESLHYAAELYRYDPLADYLNGLQWDGQPRCKDWLTDYFDAPRNEWTGAIAERWLVSAAARGLAGGCKADYVLVLEGSQGLGKSSGLRALAGQEWFTDRYIDIGTIQGHMAVHGAWIIELAELASVRKAEQGKIKAFVTLQEDSYTPKYLRFCHTYPRRCVFAGTVNDFDWANDPSGGRRWWPVRCGTVAVEKIAGIRDQLWAEAVHLYRSGYKWWIDSESLSAMAAGEIEERYIGDPWEETVQEYLHDRLTRVLMTELFDLVKLEAPRREDRHSKRMADILRRCGWKRGRFGPNKNKCWVPENT